MEYEKISKLEKRFFPSTMIHLPIWVLWRLEDRNSKKTKVPYQIGGKRASSTDPATWATYGDTIEEWEAFGQYYQGIGAVMSKQNRLVFIDIDHCILPDGQYDERANDILEAFTNDNGNLTTFCEYSQSGTGLHLITIGEIPRCFNNRKKGVEMYDDGRFIAMTGNALAACEPSECTDGINYIYNKYKTTAAASSDNCVRVDPSTRRSDNWIIDHAKAREKKFADLFAGEWSKAGYESQSEADLALCLILSFWTDRDPVSMDRLFRQSGLYRYKWERASYRDTTLRKAINELGESLSEFQTRRMREEGRQCLEWFDCIRRDH